MKESAFAQTWLLQNVVDFKMKFYPRKWAAYQNATPAGMKLMPPEYRVKALAADYQAMQDMLFGNIPAFDEIIVGIRQLEAEIHSL